MKAIAVSTGYANSPVGSAAYSIGVATPALSPAGGTYTSIQTVTISDATGGATIYYTTNGTTPTTSSPIYSTPITVSMSQTLEALGVLSGSANSAVAPAAYVINLTAAMPAFSPAAGTFNSAQTVTISDATGGATIYYTTNGFTPTTSSPTYSAPISVSATETLEALATYAGDANSAVASAIYNLQVATPAFSPAAGSYSTDQSVTISDSTGGATIYYTTNGSTPTTGSAIYSGPVPVTTAQTLEAIGVLTGYSNSTTASAAYTFPPPTSSPSYVQQCTGIQTYGTADSCTLTGVTAGDAIVVGVYTSNALVSVTSSIFAPRHSGITHPKHFAIPLQQWTPAIASERIAQVIAHRSRQRPHQNDPRQLQLPLSSKPENLPATAPFLPAPELPHSPATTPPPPPSTHSAPAHRAAPPECGES